MFSCWDWMEGWAYLDPGVLRVAPDELLGGQPPVAL